MAERHVTIELNTGLQSRAASEFVQKANQFTAHIFLEKGNRQINAKSIMGLMSLAITSGETITLKAEGEDEEEALDTLENLVSQAD